MWLPMKHTEDLGFRMETEYCEEFLEASVWVDLRSQCVGGSKKGGFKVLKRHLLASKLSPVVQPSGLPKHLG